jgi:hypothetical protein
MTGGYGSHAMFDAIAKKLGGWEGRGSILARRKSYYISYFSGKSGVPTKSLKRP